MIPSPPGNAPRHWGVRLVLAWHVVALLVALVVDRTLFAALLAWTAVAVAAFRYRPAPYLPWAFGLAVAEETLVYAVGGGLHGAARSLLHAFAVALPSFAALALGFDVQTAFLLAGTHGLLLELGLNGLFTDPGAVLLLGGPTVVIYGSVLAGPELPGGDRPATARALAVGWLGVTALLVLSGVVAAFLEPLVA